MSTNGETISIQTLKRLPLYLNYLEKLDDDVINISTPKMASDLGLTDILVKKDLMGVVKVSGRPKIGHEVKSLIDDIRDYLGYNNVSSAVLVGAGHLGKALLNFHEFKKWNVEIAIAFDNNPKVIGREINNIKILDIGKLVNLCQKMSIHMGIITTSAEAAQETCDKLVEAGIKGIWNFAPVTLKVPDGVFVEDVNLASSLAMLSHKLQK